MGLLINNYSTNLSLNWIHKEKDQISLQNLIDLLEFSKTRNYIKFPYWVASKD